MTDGGRRRTKEILASNIGCQFNIALALMIPGTDCRAKPHAATKEAAAATAEGSYQAAAAPVAES